MVPFLQKAGFIGDDYDLDHLTKVASLIQERLPRLDAVRDFHYLFLEPEVPTTEIKKVLKDKDGQAGLQAVIAATESLPWQEAELETAIRQTCRTRLEHQGAFMTLRLALCGGKASPPLFSTMEVIGKERVIRRLQAAAALL